MKDDYKIICPSEIDDFKHAISKQGFVFEDFLIEETDTISNIFGVHPVTGTVKITYKPSKNFKIYPAGHGTNWEGEFEKDLEDDYF